ncbi:thiamine phosphate synthase [Natronospora cellulosivora (SeqCode)]
MSNKELLNKILLNTDIYCISAEKYSRGRSNIEVVREMLAADIKLIQYREKEKTMKDMYQECLEIREMTRESGAIFLINDYIDLAQAIDADGVHLGQDDMPIEVARSILGEEKIIGLSTHSPEQAREALKKEVDYIGVGPIFKTNTKVCPAVGLEYLEYVVDNIDLPFVAIGGIKEDNISSVRRKGATCICLVTEIVGAENIQEKINSIRNQIN